MTFDDHEIETANNVSYLADLTDDLTPEQLVKCLNYLAITDMYSGPRYSIRARIKGWRLIQGLKNEK